MLVLISWKGVCLVDQTNGGFIFKQTGPDAVDLLVVPLCLSTFLSSTTY